MAKVMAKAMAKVRVKVFKERKSLLIELLEQGGNYTGFYHIIIAQLALFVGAVAVKNILFVEDFSFEIRVFGGASELFNFFIFELIQLSIALTVYPLFRLWVTTRSYGGRLVDIVFALGYLIVCFGSIMPLWDIIGNFPPVLRSISTLEHMRFIMKSYSFIRENAMKVIKPWTKDDDDGPNIWYNGQMNPLVGSFNKYFYFMFVPTFIYRDNYPRLKSICWSNVGAYTLQFLILCYAMSKYIPYFMPPSFQLKDLTTSYCMSLILSTITTLLCCITILHCWLNINAELTTFADRQFYTDWWNSTSYSVFYRKWNVPVYDWLIVYVYQDLHSILGSRWASAVSVFFLSSIMHDYHIAAGIGHFLPVLLILFTGCGGTLYLVRPDANSKLGNILTMVGLFFGVAVILAVHLTEVAARKYCLETDKYLHIATLDCF